MCIEIESSILQLVSNQYDCSRYCGVKVQRATVHQFVRSELSYKNCDSHRNARANPGVLPSDSLLLDTRE